MQVYSAGTTVMRYYINETSSHKEKINCSSTMCKLQQHSVMCAQKPLRDCSLHQRYPYHASTG